MLTTGRIAEPFGVAKERTNTAGCVAVSGNIVKQRERSIGCVFDTRGVNQKRARTKCCVLVADVGKEGSGADTSVELAFLVAHEREQPNCRVVGTGSETKKRVWSFRCVASGITAVLRRANRFRSLKKSCPGRHRGNDKHRKFSNLPSLIECFHSRQVLKICCHFGERKESGILVPFERVDLHSPPVEREICLAHVPFGQPALPYMSPLPQPPHSPVDLEKTACKG